MDEVEIIQLRIAHWIISIYNAGSRIRSLARFDVGLRLAYERSKLRSFLINTKHQGAEILLGLIVSKKADITVQNKMTAKYIL